MVFSYGDRVEVIGVDLGFEHSYFTARVLDVSVTRLRVVYETLIDDNGGALQELVNVCRVRPYPVEVDVNLEVDDVVDVWDRDGWWKGRIVAEQSYSVAVYFDYMVEEEHVQAYRRENVRIHQTWRGGEESPYWVYRRPKRPFYVGERVEVMGRELGLENSFFAARVFNIGRTTLSVVYTTLRNEDGGDLVEELRFRRVRPYPAKVHMTLGVGNIVDVWERDGWWKGKLISENADSFNAFFDYMVEGEQLLLYRKNVVRIHQVLQVAEVAYYWSYGML